MHYLPALLHSKKRSVQSDISNAIACPRPFGLIVPGAACNADSCASGRKSCAITTARRLGQFLGDERIKDKGLNCNYIVAKRPENLPTSERAIPLAIFSTSPAIARAYLRKWCGDFGGSKPRSYQELTYDAHNETLLEGLTCSTS